MEIHHILLPDGSNYLLGLASVLALENLNSLIDEGKKRGLTDLRILTKKQNHIRLENYPLEARQTVYFGYDINKIKILKENEFLINYNDLELKKADLSGATDVGILKNFMLNSFGVKFAKGIDGQTTNIIDDIKQERILRNLELIKQSTELKVYFVYFEGLIVGTFSLQVLGNEVQLHSVAARSDLENSYLGPNKLYILVRGLVDLLTETNLGVDKLVFSSSKQKVAQMYKNIGFEEDADLICLQIRA